MSQEASERGEIENKQLDSRPNVIKPMITLNMKGQIKRHNMPDWIKEEKIQLSAV